MKLLEATFMDPSDEPHEIETLREELRELRQQLHDSQRETDTAKRESQHALSNLRKQLNPLYKALQMVFGELDAAGVDEAPAASGATRAQWDEWKTRLGPSCAKVIDALILGGEMTVKGIMASAKMGPNTVYQATSKMGQVGILTKNGGKFSLKKL